MKIVVASNNKNKIKELRALLSEFIPDVELMSLSDVGIFDDIVEDGQTFEDNAKIKARAAATSGYVAIGDDSGLCVNALGGAPGVFSARYAGGHGDDAANNALLLKNLEGESDRSAYFVCVLACVFPDGKELCVEGRADGVILTEARGEGGFGYDPYFYYPPLGKTFSEFSAEQKNAVSHRGAAVRELGRILANLK